MHTHATTQIHTHTRIRDTNTKTICGARFTVHIRMNANINIGCWAQIPMRATYTRHTCARTACCCDDGRRKHNLGTEVRHAFVRACIESSHPHAHKNKKQDRWWWRRRPWSSRRRRGITRCCTRAPYCVLLLLSSISPPVIYQCTESVQTTAAASTACYQQADRMGLMDRS